jgi:Tfp pilus assembly protein PilF
MSRRALIGLVVVAACASSQHVRKTEAEGRALRSDLAEMYIEKKAYDAALPLLKRSLAEDPKNPHLHTLYATVLRERALYPQAEGEYLTALKLDEKHAPAWAGIALLYDLTHRPVDAERAHRRALALAPGAAAYYNNYGFSLYIAGRYDEAIVVLEKALLIDPTLSVAYNNLGFAYGRRGRYDDAERTFRTGGGEIAAKLNLALVYEQNGDGAAAARLRAEAHALDPDLDQELHP